MTNRKIVLFGAGQLCISFLRHETDVIVEFILDNDKERAGSFFEGITIKHPSEVDNLEDYFIIIATQYHKEIASQLDDLGLIWQKNYIELQKLYLQEIDVQMVQKSFENCAFGEIDEDKEVERKIYSKEQYDEIHQNYGKPLLYEKMLSSLYYQLIGKTGPYLGFCEACGTSRNFIVDYFWSTTKEPAWRETVTCPVCNCNSRMRYMVEKVKSNYQNNKVYLYERVTKTYEMIEKYVQNLTGSEYIGDAYKSGDIVEGILHEDALNLSFDENEFDVMISDDVFEHVGDYIKAFGEAYRCLKKGGKLVITIPIFKERYKNIKRTILNESGSLQYLLDKQYHGNPLSQEGSLVCTEFGWEIIDDLKNVGFSDAYAVTYFSVKKGYFGSMPVVFEAIK